MTLTLVILLGFLDLAYCGRSLIKGFPTVPSNFPLRYLSPLFSPVTRFRFPRPLLDGICL